MTCWANHIVKGASLVLRISSITFYPSFAFGPIFDTAITNMLSISKVCDGHVGMTSCHSNFENSTWDSGIAFGFDVCDRLYETHEGSF